MPKLKTNRAAAKRFRRSKNGKFLRGKAGTRHLKTAKTSKRRRTLRVGGQIDPTEVPRMKRLLPYS
ncbi:MAG: 50S ribosomal protein L35 [Candidatus Hydrogenedentes bacterium]|nr:50S ribosomal protein L35 [Candidatus Hydrogenedentota bacterium]MBI3119074.1 50S ribosomal protein L35 [Candidatus Hydrogenedentota bacterium]